MATITREKLLEAGAHFGHPKKRWSPKMKEYIFDIKNGVHIIDLQKTIVNLEKALEFVRQITKEGKKILFVATKKQAKAVVKDYGLKTHSFFVNQRWLGGTLTNFQTIRKSIEKLWELDRNFSSGYFDNWIKKERLEKLKDKEDLEKNLSGIKYMRSLPGAIFVVDTNVDKIAITEAVKLKIPVIAMCDTNSDPDLIDYVIPANDDAAKTINLIVSEIANAILEASGKGEELTKLDETKTNESEKKEVKVEKKEEVKVVSSQESEEKTRANTKEGK